jgi:hypothetical protein
LNHHSNSIPLYPIKINQLKPNESNPKESYLKAYKSHKKVAENLFMGNLYRDSYLSLIIASECLLKGIFNSLKTHIFGTSNNKMQSWIIVESIYKKQKEDFLPAKEFKHDLRTLKSTIKDLFEEFNRGIYSKIYAQFTDATDDLINWQEERYKDPYYLDKDPRKNTNWKVKSQELLDALNNLENKALNNLFGEQND